MMRGVMGLQISCSALIGVHSTMHLMHPNLRHYYYYIHIHFTSEAMKFCMIMPAS